jgi:hypothetical protein
VNIAPRWGVAAIAVTAGLITAAPAAAHQTAYSHGVAVTMHVSPDDAPVAGRSATVNIVSVNPPGRPGFSFRSGNPRLRITDSSGHVIRRGRAGRHTKVTFPRPGAYQLTFSGRYKRAGKRHSFAARFAIRAS